MFSNSDNSNSELLSSVSSVNLVTNRFNTCQHIINDDNKTWVCICVSSCNWRPFQTEPGPWRSGGRDNHRCSAGVSFCSHKCPITSIDHTDGPAHQLFTLTSKVSALKHFSPPHRFLVTLVEATIYLFLTDMHICSCVCVCVPCSRCVLDSSEHSGSQLRSSQQPSVAQLNPLPSLPPPLFTVPEGLVCTAEGHVLGTRARRQAKAAAAPLHLYLLCYSSLSSPSTMV